MEGCSTSGGASRLHQNATHKHQQADHLHPIDEDFSDPPEASSPSSSQQARRVKRRIEPDTTETPTAGNQPGNSVGTPQALTKLPPEIFVITFDLALASAFDTARDYNAGLEKLRQVCRWRRDVIDDAAIFWLRITSNSPFKFNKMAIQNSKRTKKLGPPFTVEFIPRSLNASTKWKEFSEFMKLVGSYRSQWKSLNIILPSGRLDPLTRFTTTPAHHLKSLALSMTVENPAGQGMRSNAYKRLNLMRGAASRLKDVVLENIPVHYDPGLFVNLRQLQLSGVQICPDELIAFTNDAPFLQIFKLGDVFSTKPFQSSSRDRVVVPSLERLILQELSNPINLSNFFLTLHAPNCRYLHIELIQDFEGAQEDPEIALNQLGRHISAIVHKTLNSELMRASHV
ncbi:hypothetical protein FS837_010049 [Tulasnella sp. UAMH 9824]|nr:hypothetical protein FS837_010049 [Tulasnella sp. UAMH 9824]